MPRMVGTFVLQLQKRVRAEDFEAVMLDQVFDKAAEVEGSTMRGGRSMIKSQHLLKSEGGAPSLWLVKADEELESLDIFTTVLSRMHAIGAKLLKGSAVVSDASRYVVSGSFDAGPRDVIGTRLGKGERGDFF